MEPAGDVWLVDHALSFAEVSDAVAAMRAYPDLLRRIAGILELPCQEAVSRDATEAPTAAASSPRCEAAIAADGVTTPHDARAGGDATPAEAEGQGVTAGYDALMQQVVGRLHEVVYEAVFQESAGGQPSKCKHRQAHPWRALPGPGPAGPPGVCWSSVHVQALCRPRCSYEHIEQAQLPSCAVNDQIWKLFGSSSMWCQVHYG